MMALKFDDLRVLQTAESLADEIWHQVLRWEDFAKDIVGKQLARAIDSVGANIAEAFGRFHYGEKLQFLYYACGSLFEAKYRLNRALKRNLMDQNEAKRYASQLSELARQLNAFAGMIKSQRRGGKSASKSVRESVPAYVIEQADISPVIITNDEIKRLKSTPNF